MSLRLFGAWVGRLLVGIAIVVAMTFLISLVLNYSPRADVKPIDDPHGLLTTTQHNDLMEKLLINYAKTGVHIVIWLPQLDKQDVLLDKAVDYFKQKGIGQKQYDNGLLLLVDWGNRRIRTEVGYGLESVITDSVAKRVQTEAMLPHFKDGKLFEGLMAGVDRLTELSAKWAKWANSDKTAKVETTESAFGAVKWIVGFLGIVIIVFSVVIVLARQRRREEAQIEAERIKREERLERAEEIARQRAVTLAGIHTVTRTISAKDVADLQRDFAESQRNAAYRTPVILTRGPGDVMQDPAITMRQREANERREAKAQREKAARLKRDREDSEASRRRRRSDDDSSFGAGLVTGWLSSESSSSSSSLSDSSSSSSYDSGGGSSGGGGSDSSWDD